MRNARKLENGHYLVAHYGGKRVVEYDEMVISIGKFLFRVAPIL